MKPPPVTYHAPETLDDALALLAEHGDEAKVLAGGQSLLPMMNLRLASPAHLVDIMRLPELDFADLRNGVAEVGAGLRQADAEDDPVLLTSCPLLAATLPHIAHREIRNAGTICGSLAHAAPAAELPAVALAVDAELVARSVRGERTIAAADFFVSVFETALRPDELLVAARFPAARPGTGVAFHELARRAGDFAIAGVAATVTVDGELVTDARVACLGVAPVPVRARATEEALIGRAPDAETLATAARAGATDLEPPGDVHASPEFRRHAAETLIRRAVADAMANAQLTNANGGRRT